MFGVRGSHGQTSHELNHITFWLHLEELHAEWVKGGRGSLDPQTIRWLGDIANIGVRLSVAGLGGCVGGPRIGSPVPRTLGLTNLPQDRLSGCLT